MDLHGALHWAFSFQCVHKPLDTPITSHLRSLLNLFGKMTKARTSWQRRWLSQSHMRRIHRIKDQFRLMWHCQKVQTSLSTIRHHTKPLTNSVIKQITYTSYLNNKISIYKSIYAIQCCSNHNYHLRRKNRSKCHARLKQGFS